MKLTTYHDEVPSEIDSSAGWTSAIIELVLVVALIDSAVILIVVRD